MFGIQFQCAKQWNQRTQVFVNKALVTNGMCSVLIVFHFVFAETLARRRSLGTRVFFNVPKHYCRSPQTYRSLVVEFIVFSYSVSGYLSTRNKIQINRFQNRQFLNILHA